MSITLEGNEIDKKLNRALKMMRVDEPREWFLYVKGYPEFRFTARNATEALKAKAAFKRLYGLKIMPSGALLTEQRRGAK